MATTNQAEELYGILIQCVTKHFPDEPFGARTDLVMDLYQQFHKWATGEHDEVHGATKQMIELDVDL